MTAVTYQHLALNWAPDNKRDSFFNKLTIAVVILSVVLALIVSAIHVPKQERKERTVVPERVAKFIMQKKKPKIVKAPPKPEPKSLPRIVKRINEKKLIDKPLTKIQKKARIKAESSGLLALNKELSDLMDTSSINAMVGNKIKSSASSSQATKVNTSVLTANASAGSGGVSKDKYTTQVSKTILSNEEKIAFRQSLSTNGNIRGKDLKSAKRGDNVRAEEDIIFVMDQNKSKLHTIYRRARRAHPGLKGKIILEITIAASGKVLSVNITSSELNDPNLESSLVARIKQFNFGAHNVEKVTVTFPIEFLPS